MLFFFFPLFGKKGIMDTPDQQVAIMGASHRRIISSINEEKEIKHFLLTDQIWDINETK